MTEHVTGNIFSFRGSILGFEQYDQFQVVPVNEDEPFLYLQSCEDQNIGFLITSPFWIVKDYEFEISDADRKLLDIQTQDEIIVFSIVTIREPFKNSTINLLAPLLANIRTKAGKQIVLPTKYNYSTQTSLFEGQAHTEGGDQSC